MILLGSFGHEPTEDAVVDLGELIMILDLQRQGLSISAIALQSGLDRKTVRKYIRQGTVAPKYKPRTPRVTRIEPFKPFLRERLATFPKLSGARLLREIGQLGYTGGKSCLNDYLRQIRPLEVPPFEVRFETPAGHQAQVDFAEFRVRFGHEPQLERKVWLFALVLGPSRYLWAQFVMHQDLPTVLRCHIDAFEHLGGAPRQILYDQMKTAVNSDATDTRPIIYNGKLLACAAHYGFTPKACQPYRAKTKGKVERGFRYVRADFFMARQFLDMADLNQQLRQWLDTVANVRLHGSTDRVVAEHFEQERPTLTPLPAGRFDAVLRSERRLNSEGSVSVGGNYYSVPDGTARRMLAVQTTPHEVHIFDEDRLLAVHPRLNGRKQRSVLRGHRQARTKPSRLRATPTLLLGHAIANRALAVYEQIGRQLSQHSEARR